MENGQFQLIKTDMDLKDGINEVIDLSMLNALRKNIQILLVNRFKDEVNKIYSDLNRVKQVLINFLSNSIKF